LGGAVCGSVFVRLLLNRLQGNGSRFPKCSVLVGLSAVLFAVRFSLGLVQVNGSHGFYCSLFLLDNTSNQDAPHRIVCSCFLLGVVVMPSHDARLK